MMAHKVIVKTLIIISVMVIVQSCASVKMLPKNAAEIDFYGAEGKTGWSQYRHTETFANYTLQQVYDAAKVGLGDAGFSLLMADINKGMAVGEHGMTMHDWNIIAGVYFVEHKGAVKVAVIIEGSKDIGFSGDVTSDGWSGKILKGMRDYLNSANQSILKIDKKDIK